MKRYFYILLLLFTPLFIQANDLAINEYKSDIYFANGIMTDEDAADENKRLIKEKVLAEQYGDNLSRMEQELNFKVAYNQTYGFTGDIYEAYLQLANESDGWLKFYGFISYVLGNTESELDWYDQALALITEDMNEAMIRQTYEADLSVQIQDYKNSIALGHGVIVVSHSQGNLFTNDAYKNITQDDGSWRKDYFTAIAVASPATKLLEDGNNDPHIGFDNDPVAWLGTLGTTTNPNRSYKFTNALGESVENSFDLQFHSFDYYMGETIAFEDGVSQRNVSTDIGKNIIMNFLSAAVESHKDTPSQWETDEELNKNTIDYRITLKHRFDSSIFMNEEVYPFAPSKKLYYVNGDIFGYVKASSGGTEILADWEDKKNNESYLLVGTGELIVYDIKYSVSFIYEIYAASSYMSKVLIYEENTDKLIDSISLQDLDPNIFNTYQKVSRDCSFYQFYDGTFDDNLHYTPFIESNERFELTVNYEFTFNSTEILSVLNALNESEIYQAYHSAWYTQVDPYQCSHWHLDYDEWDPVAAGIADNEGNTFVGITNYYREAGFNFNETLFLDKLSSHLKILLSLPDLKLEL